MMLLRYIFYFLRIRIYLKDDLEGKIIIMILRVFILSNKLKRQYKIIEQTTDWSDIKIKPPFSTIPSCPHSPVYFEMKYCIGGGGISRDNLVSGTKGFFPARFLISPTDISYKYNHQNQNPNDWLLDWQVAQEFPFFRLEISSVILMNSALPTLESAVFGALVIPLQDR